MEYEYAIQLAFKATNNEVEYKTLLAGLIVAASLGVEEIEARVNAQVVVNQVKGEFAVKSERLRRYLQEVERRRAHFRYFQIQQVLKVENQKVDKLGKAASGQEGYSLLEEAVVRIVEVPGIRVEAFEVAGIPGWAEEIVRYLEADELP